MFSDFIETMARLPDGTELLTCGFPCQDVSSLGKMQGLAGSRFRLLIDVFRLLKATKVVRLKLSLKALPSIPALPYLILSFPNSYPRPSLSSL